MNILPKAVAATLEQLASGYAWRAANERAGEKKDVQRDLRTIDQYGRDLALQFQEIGLDSACHAAVLEILAYTGWHAANERYKYNKDALRDETMARDAVQKLTTTGRVTPALAMRIKELGSAYGWHAANTRKHMLQDATNDMNRVKVILTQITGA